MAVNDVARSTTTVRVIALFKNQDDAYRALTQLKQAGFSSDEIGIMYGGQDEAIPSGSRSTSGKHEGFWDKVKNFFTGDESHESPEDGGASISDMDWDRNRSDYYRAGLESGGALVSVAGGNAQRAREILEGCGGELRESGFSSPNTRGTIADTGQDDYRIQMRGEVLRAHKERVQRGEVRLRKEVITQNQSIDVPVTREELVVERVAPSGASASGEIGSDQEIRVPLSEERARVEKQPVVTEEVRVGKRAVTGTEQVSDSLRHE